MKTIVNQLDQTWEKHATTLPRQLVGGLLAGAGLPWLLSLKDPEMRENPKKLVFMSVLFGLLTPIVVLLMYGVRHFWNKGGANRLLSLVLGFFGLVAVLVGIGLVVAFLDPF